jgi:hypothetical protein
MPVFDTGRARILNEQNDFYHIDKSAATTPAPGSKFACVDSRYRNRRARRNPAAKLLKSGHRSQYGFLQEPTKPVVKPGLWRIHAGIAQAPGAV